MSLSNKQVNLLASLGRQVALAVQSGDAQEPERHIPVSGQVRGYLRWYGDLTGAIGYWPLAEAIAYALEEGECRQSRLQWLAGQFAGAWGSAPECVEEEMEAAAWAAVEERQDFALLVMGGAPPKEFLPHFVLTSARWLKRYRISLRGDYWREKEAVWVRRQQAQVRRDAAYISTEDYLIVSELSRGRGRRALAQRLDCTLERLTAQYQQAVERARLIVSKSSAVPIPVGRESWSIADYLNAIGMPPHSEGQAVLEAALRLAREQPDLLGGMTDKFYPTLGKGLCESPDNASRHVRAAIDRLSERPNSVDFFDFAGLSGGTANHCQRFFEAFLRYMAL